MADRAVSTRFLFVYGTLMKGFQEDWQTQVGARLVATGRINGKLYDLGEYPGAVCAASDSGQYVKGELYELIDPDLATSILDQFEEFFPGQPHKSLFLRIIAPVTLEDGRRQNAWVYVYNKPVDETKLVPSGDYRDKFAGREH